MDYIDEVIYEKQAARIAELEAQLAEKDEVRSAAIREAAKKSTTQIFKPSSGELREITRLCKQWIHAANWPFDPNLHEAVMHGKGKEGMVIEEVQRGYKFRDRVIRPTMVVVGNGEEETEKKEEE